MSLSLEEIRAMRATTPDFKKESYVRQLKERQGAAQKISELVADPRWEVWGREVENLRDSYARRSETAKLKLLNHLLNRDDYLAVKFEQSQADAAIVAISNVLQIAKTLIEQGEGAVEALKNVQAE